MIIMLTGLSGAGKSTLSLSTQLSLKKYGVQTEIIDGDEYRRHLCKDLGFSREDRLENIRRLGCVANQFSAKGAVAIISAINPYQESRDEIIVLYPNVQLVFIDCPIETLKKRDTKGLYKRSLYSDGHPEKLTNLSGINDNYDRPESPDLYINTSTNTLTECTAQLEEFIMEKLPSVSNTAALYSESVL